MYSVMFIPQAWYFYLQLCPCRSQWGCIVSWPYPKHGTCTSNCVLSPILVVSILWLYDTYCIIHFSYTILQMIHFYLFRIFWSLKYPNPCEICGYIKFFWSKTRKNISLVHIEYRFKYIMICIISLKINDTEP